MIFVAAKVVGFIIKGIGIGFIGWGVYNYLSESMITLGEVIFPSIVGLILIFVGKSMAETVVKIVGLLVVIWGLMGLGIIPMPF